MVHSNDFTSDSPGPGPRRTSSPCRVLYLALALIAGGTTIRAAESPTPFLEFIRGRAAALRGGDSVPATTEAWTRREAELRARLEQAWGGFPTNPVPLEPRVFGSLERDGYRVERLMFRTLPEVWMTANAYVPNRPGRLPAVLCVHGHWRGAKQDPVVQARCIGLARLGFFVLAVDAFGAGERGVGKALGEYHGDMTAATLLPIGRPLSGIQVYENSRAVDYLLTRPEVDPERIGITGASGGGNQSMYAGAWDRRLKAVVPVCSVGNYQAYLGAACCMCEVVPGALRFTEESGVLSLVAPRALMVVNATRDARQFSVEEARKSLEVASPIFRLLGRPDALRHAIFESGHDYSQPMRETVYGWMTRHLKSEGDGSPVPEPPVKTEDPEALRCFPGDSRPDDWMTLPRFAARLGRDLLASLPDLTNQGAWLARRNRLDVDVLGGTGPRPSKAPTHASHGTNGLTELTFEPEPGIRLVLHRFPGNTNRNPVLILDLDGTGQGRAAALAKDVAARGANAWTLDLRATGVHAEPRDRIGRAPDHNTAEWSLWLGRPLLGQWLLDVRAAMDAIQAQPDLGRMPFSVVGFGPAGIVAMTAAVLDSRIYNVHASGGPASFLGDAPYENLRLGILAPGIVRDYGDVPHLAAALGGRLFLHGAVDGSGKALDEAGMQAAFEVARRSASRGEGSVVALPPVIQADPTVRANQVVWTVP